MLQLKRAFQIYNESQEGISPKENGNEQSKKKMFRHNSMVKPIGEDLLKTTQNAIKKATKAPKDPNVPKAQPRPIDSPEPYICTCCNFVFKRKVTYDQHIKVKNLKSFMTDSTSTSSDESESPQMRRKYYNKKMIERDPTFYPDDSY